LDSIQPIPDFRNYLEKEILRDGSQVTIRAIRSTDKLALLDGFHRLSKKSIHSRFFGGKHDLSEAELKFFTEVDFQNHVALVMEFEADRRPMGVGRFNVNSMERPIVADIAITVDEASHGLGIGTLLLDHLITIGQKLDIDEFHADVLESNKHMLNIIGRLKLPVRKQKTGDLVNIRIEI